MKVSIWRNKLIIVKPKPLKNIEGAIRLRLNKDFSETTTDEMYANIYAGQKCYPIPKLPNGVKLSAIYLKK